MYLAHRHNVEIEGTSQGSIQTFHVSCIQHEMHAFGSYLAFTHITTFSLQDPINKSLWLMFLQCFVQLMATRECISRPFILHYQKSKSAKILTFNIFNHNLYFCEWILWLKSDCLISFIQTGLEIVEIVFQSVAWYIWAYWGGPARRGRKGCAILLILTHF
jgi:hypothetical protein